MCWRDDVVTQRYCTFCGQEYYGDLGHRDCPTLKKSEPTKTETKASDLRRSQ